ncbi:MAG: MvdC/MvdD family ATP grasp protein [Caulobacteraceae bacterium]
MRDKILILTQDFDPMADRLVVELGQRNVECIRWHTDGLTATSTVEMSFARDCEQLSVTAHGRSFASEEIRSVWNRRQEPLKLPDRLSESETDFAKSEMSALLFGVVRTSNWCWVNHPDRNRYASAKPLQLSVARRLGLEIPRTCITNDPRAAQSFIRQCAGRAIYKTLYSPYLADTDMACFTSVVNEDHLSQLDAIQFTGGIFQEYVPKKFELRITIIGSHVFATEIHSQDLEETRVDWRRSSTMALKHVDHALPFEIDRKCRALVAAFGLTYSAMDMIVTPDGDYVFLENNPSGQYGWIEDLTGAPLTASLADLLIAGEPD